MYVYSANMQREALIKFAGALIADTDSSRGGAILVPPLNLIRLAKS